MCHYQRKISSVSLSNFLESESLIFPYENLLPVTLFSASWVCSGEEEMSLLHQKLGLSPPSPASASCMYSRGEEMSFVSSLFSCLRHPSLHCSLLCFSQFLLLRFFVGFPSYTTAPPPLPPQARLVSTLSNLRSSPLSPFLLLCHPRAVHEKQI